MLCPMFIRRTRTRTGDRGEVYYSHRLVRSERSGEKVRQRTLLNLGSDFPVERGHWAVLCARIQQLLDRQGELVPLSCPEEVERHAQRIAAQLLNSAPSGGTGGAELQTVDVGSLELIRPRSVGVEHVGLWAMERLGLEALLERLGFNGTQRALAMATVIARMAAPGSERASWRWLCERSALGELLGVDFERMSMMRLYRASDALMSHRAAIEAHLFDRATDLFGLRSTVTLYDLTNTFFEGAAAAQPKAERGHSKEKRSDCPLLTLGLVLDGSGFVRRSEVFSGAVNENRTLASMLGALGAPADALVVMDAGIATEATRNQGVADHEGRGPADAEDPGQADRFVEIFLDGGIVHVAAKALDVETDAADNSDDPIFRQFPARAHDGDMEFEVPALLVRGHRRPGREPRDRAEDGKLLPDDAQLPVGLQQVLHRLQRPFGIAALVVEELDEGVCEPSLRIDIVELGGADQGVHRRSPHTAAVGAGEQPRFS